MHFYRLLAERLQEHCGISRDDIVVSMIGNTDADWSFGEGRAQFLTGKLGLGGVPKDADGKEIAELLVGYP